MSSTTERSFSRVESAVQIRFRPGSLPPAADVGDDVEPDEDAGIPAVEGTAAAEVPAGAAFLAAAVLLMMLCRYSKLLVDSSRLNFV